MTGVANLTAITDANNHTTSFTYDKVNRKLTETFPDLSNNTITWTYDDVGNVLTRTDQKSQVTTYTYSDLYFLLSRSYPSGVDSFTYDLSGRVLSGNTTRGAGWNESFQYDGSDRLVQSVQNSQTISYVYNIPGRTRMLTYPGGRTITEQKDFRDFRLVNVNDSGPTPIAQYTYDQANNVLTRGYRNNTITNYTYNQNNWVCSLVHKSGANLIVGFTYAYDNEGNKFYEQKLHELGRSEAYTYDSVYRLVDYQVGQLSASPPPNCPTGALGVPNPVTQTSYTLDKLGNWLDKDTDGNMQLRMFSPSNEITSIGPLPVVSDFDGNTTMYASSGYQYDEENRLIKATEGPLQTTRGVYLYDAFGRRVSQTVGAVATLYYYDGWRTIEEQSSGGLTQATYVFGNYPDEALTMDRGGHTYYYHQNALLSVFALTDPSGAGVEGYYYDAYGYQTVVLPGPDGILDFDSDDDYSPGARSSVGNPFLFTGQRLDPETGLLYYKNRHDSTFFGRFLQRDPLDYIDGMSLYEYVKDDPTNRTDWNGKTTGGDTICNIKGDKPITNNNNDECTRPCTAAHEKVHYDDFENAGHPLGKCCMAARAAYKKATTPKDQNEVITKYNGWFSAPDNEALRECPGYTKSVECADKMWKDKKCEECPKEEPKGTEDEVKKWEELSKCCGEIHSYLEHTKKLKNDYCGKAAGKMYSACPL